MTPLDPAALRRRFPALSRTGEDGRPIIYADAPGGSQVPETVIDAIAGHLRSGITNTHGAFAASEETDALIAEARSRGGRHHRRRPGRDRVRAELDDAPAASLAVVRAHARSRRRGRRHEARPRRERPAVGAGGRGRRRHGPLGRHPRRRRHARPRLVRRGADRSDALGRVHARIERGGHDPTRRRADPRASTPRERSSPWTACTSRSIARSICTGWTPTSSRARRTSSSGRTWACWRVRRELLETWTPYKLRPAPDEAPERWETGTQNHEGLAGLVAAVDYLADVGRTYGDASRRTRRDAVVAGFGAIGAHERELAARFLRGVGRHPERSPVGHRRRSAARRTDADVRGPRRRSGPAEDGDRARAARHLRLGRALLRDHRDGAARTPRLRRRRSDRLLPLPLRGRRGPGARGSGRPRLTT